MPQSGGCRKVRWSMAGMPSIPPAARGFVRPRGFRESRCFDIGAQIFLRAAAHQQNSLAFPTQLANQSGQKLPLIGMQLPRSRGLQDGAQLLAELCRAPVISHIAACTVALDHLPPPSLRD